MSRLTLFLLVTIIGYSHAERPTHHGVHAAAMDRAIQINKYWAGPESNDVDSNDGIPHRDRENCGSITKVLKPYTIKVKDTTKRVVQTKTLKQIINTTECYEQDIPCFDGIKSIRGDIVTKCVQNYATITLYVYENSVIKPQPFEIPVSCSCRIQYQNYFTV